jgi:hypothetical protein
MTAQDDDNTPKDVININHDTGIDANGRHIYRKTHRQIVSLQSLSW